MSILLAILRAIPALKSLADQLEDVIRKSEAQSRREEKMDYIDSAIADAICHPHERVRDEETELVEDYDRSTS